MNDALDKTSEILVNSKLLITKGKTKEALEGLSNLKKFKFEKRISILSSQFYKARSEYGMGIITSEQYETKLNKINLELLEILKKTHIRIEKSGRVGPRFILSRRIWLLYLFLIVLLGIGANHIFKFTRSIVSAKNQDSELFKDEGCPQGDKSIVLVASFQSDIENSFSSSLIAALREKLPYNDCYQVGNVDFNFGSVNQIYYRDSIEKKFFSRDQKGVFVGGLWKKEDNVFNCYIELFNLKLKTPDWQTPETIILNNPTEIGLSIKNGTNFLASFISGILKTHNAKYNEALDVFDKLEDDQITSEDQYVRAYISQYKGHCHALLGNFETAEKQYALALSIGSNKVKAAVTDNIMTVAALKSDVSEYVLKQLLNSVLNNELPKEQEEWFNKECESLTKNWIENLDVELSRKICATILTPVLYYDYRYRGNIVELRDTTIEKAYFDEFVGREVAREIAKKKLKNSSYLDENQMINSIFETISETEEVVTNKLTFLGRKINRIHPEAEKLDDITKEKNAKLREQLYLQKLRENKLDSRTRSKHEQ